MGAIAWNEGCNLIVNGGNIAFNCKFNRQGGVKSGSGYNGDMLKQLFFFSLMIFLQLPVAGQELSFNQLMTKNGLSQNSIFAIAQDSQGFMWFGSRYGLNRYDGNRFKLYKSTTTDTSTLSDDYINALYSDTRKDLWVGTSNGLNRFDPKKNTFERIYLSEGQKNKSNTQIISIYEDRKGNLWIAAKNGLYLLADRKTKKFIPASLLGLSKRTASYEIQTLYEDAKGNLWLGTNKGLSRLHFANNRIKELQFFTHSARQPGSLSDNSVTAITEDLQQNIWVATENGGINLFQSGTNTFSRFLHQDGQKNGLVHNAVRRMIRSHNGKLYIGTQEG